MLGYKSPHAVGDEYHFFMLAKHSVCFHSVNDFSFKIRNRHSAVHFGGSVANDINVCVSKNPISVIRDHFRRIVAGVTAPGFWSAPQSVNKDNYL